MKRKILITAGGTGGHIFPAMGLAKQISRRYPDSQVLFVGGKLGSNKYFEHPAFSFKEVSCGPFSVKGCFSMAAGIKQSCAIISDFQPNVIVGFGSYYTFPILVAGKMKGVPLVLHEANSVPGKVNKLMAPYVTVTGIHVPSTRNHLKGNVREVGMPLRDGYKKGAVSKEEAREYFKLDRDKKTLLVFGGSQGAAALNQLMKSFKPDMQLIHITGDPKFQGNYGCVKPFENRMDLAWTAADYAITRAGAATMAEQVEYGVPGLLVPYPQATDKHQDKNADYLVELGLAKKCDEKELSPEKVAILLNEIVNNEHNMREAAERQRQKLIGSDLCDLIFEVMNR